MYMYFLKTNKVVIEYIKAYLYSFRPTCLPCLLTLLTFWQTESLDIKSTTATFELDL